MNSHDSGIDASVDVVLDWIQSIGAVFSFISFLYLILVMQAQAHASNAIFKLELAIAKLTTAVEELELPEIPTHAEVIPSFSFATAPEVYPYINQKE